MVRIAGNAHHRRRLDRDALERIAAARSRSATLLGSSEAGTRALPFEVGARYALQPGTPRRGLRRATLAGLVVAIAGAVGSAVFVASLDDFTSSPDRYGIRFDLSMELPNTNSSGVLAEVAGDPNLTAVAAAHNGLVIIDGRTVDGYGVEAIKGSLDPVIRDGRAPRASRRSPSDRSCSTRSANASVTTSC